MICLSGIEFRVSVRNCQLKSDGFSNDVMAAIFVHKAIILEIYEKVSFSPCLKTSRAITCVETRNVEKKMEQMNNFQ